MYMYVYIYIYILSARAKDDARRRADDLEVIQSNLEAEVHYVASARSARTPKASPAGSSGSSDFVSKFVITAAGTFRDLSDPKLVNQVAAHSARSGRGSARRKFSHRNAAYDPSLSSVREATFEASKSGGPFVTQTQPTDGGAGPWVNQDMRSTAPPRVGTAQPVVPPLWEPHPRSDGFMEWRAPSSASSMTASIAPSAREDREFCSALLCYVLLRDRGHSSLDRAGLRSITLR